MKKLLLLALLFVSITYAQNWGKTKVKGDGNIVKETRTVSDYDEITTGGSFYVDLVAGKEGNILLEGDKNLLDLIITEVKNNKLKVGFQKGVNVDYRSGKIKITIPFDKISKINFAGSGEIETKNPIISSSLEIILSGSGKANIETNVDKLSAILSGSGNVNISGSTTDLSIKLSGSGEIDCSNLKSSNVDTLLSGSGDITVNCNKNLMGRVSGSGNIFYSGNPEMVDKKVSGSGNIKKV
jgi:hypothetical protein